MVATRVADMSVDELKSLIQETVAETLLDLFRDPDAGLELRDNFKSVLQHSLSAVSAREFRGYSMEEVLTLGERDLKMNWRRYRAVYEQEMQR